VTRFIVWAGRLRWALKKALRRRSIGTRRTFGGGAHWCGLQPRLDSVPPRLPLSSRRLAPPPSLALKDLSYKTFTRLELVHSPWLKMTDCESSRGWAAIINQKPRIRMPRLRHATLPRIKIPFLSFLTLLLICTSSLAHPVHAASVDLTVESVWVEKAAYPGQVVASVAPGDQFNIVASVKNIGDAPASGYYLDVYYDSDYGRGGPDNITPGEVQTWYVGPLTAQAGTHTTKWVVDPDNLIAELDESNNQKEYTFTIGQQTTTTTTTASNSITSSTFSSTTNSTSTPTSSSTQSTSTSTPSSTESNSTSTSSTTQSTSTSTLSTESIGSTTTTTTTSSSSTSQLAPATLALTPVSGPAGTVVSVSGSNYQGINCVLTPVPPGLFTSQTCSIVAGVLTGGFTVDSGAPAGDYAVTVQTNAGQSDSATTSFTVIPSYTVTFYTDPNSATVTVDGASKTNGTTETYSGGQRVHVVVSPPSGYSFVSWEASGVSVDNAASADTYMTVSGNGWLKAHFAVVSSATEIHWLVRGTDNHVYYAAGLSGTSIALPGTTSDSPAACMCGGTLHMVVRGSNSVVYYGYVLLSTNAFSGWTKLQGSTASAPALAAASDCSLYLVVRGTDNRIYLSVLPRGGSWSGWRKLPGTTIDAPSVAVAGSTLHLAARGSDGSSIYHGRMDLTNNAWLGWIRVSGSTPSRPALAAVSSTEVYLAVRGSDSRVYVNRWNGVAWTGWSQILAGSTPNAPSIAAANGQLYVAVRGTDSRIYWCSRPLPSGSWSSWSKLPGSTPSSPTLA